MDCPPGIGWEVRVIVTGIQVYTKEFHTLADTPADGRGVLAYARRKDQSVQSLQGSG